MAGPERIDRFEVEAVLGAGAFATVWLARDPVLDLRVAIKVLADNWSRDQDIRARFIEEARVLWQANSPRIIRVHHVSELPDGRPYFVMSWADRGTLRQRMDARFDANTLFSVAESSSITAELARAVSDVHDIRRIHRDLKPGNVLIRSTEAKLGSPIYGLVDDEQLVLADFGLARQVEASAITLVSGSPAYVAPEQAAGLDQLTERADLYPVGLMMVELMTGSTPVDRSTMAAAAMTGPIDIGTHLATHGVSAPHELINYLQAITHPDPMQRPASAKEMADTLSRFADQPSQGVQMPGSHGVQGQGVQGQGVQGQGVQGQGVQGQGGSQSQDTHGHDAHSYNPSGQQVPAGQSSAAMANRFPGPTTGVISQETPVGQASNPPPTVVSLRGAEPANSKTGLFAGIGVLAIILLAAVGYLALRGDGNSTETNDDGTTTSAVDSPTPSATDPTVTTTSTITTTSGPAEPIELTELPLPDIAPEPSKDEFRTIANIAASVSFVEEFYRDLATYYQEREEEPVWVFKSSEDQGEAVKIELESPNRIANVRVEPTATVTSSNLSKITIVYQLK